MNEMLFTIGDRLMTIGSMVAVVVGIAFLVLCPVRRTIDGGVVIPFP